MAFFVCYNFTEIEPAPEYYSVSPTSAAVDQSSTYCYESTATDAAEATAEIVDLNTQLATQRENAADMIDEINDSIETPTEPSAPGRLDVVLPADGTTGVVVSATNTFSWIGSEPNFADFYDVQFSTSAAGDFDSGVILSVTTSGGQYIDFFSYVVEENVFDNSSIYYWRMRGSILNYLKGDWSSIFSFTTADPLTIPEGAETYTDFIDDRITETEKSKRKPSGIFRH